MVCTLLTIPLLHAAFLKDNTIWPSFLSDLFSWTKSPSSKIREGALIIFSAVVDDNSSLFEPHCATLVQLLNAGMCDPESLNVQLLSVKSIPTLIKAAASRKSQLQIFKQLAPQILNVCTIIILSSKHCPRWLDLY